MFPLHDKTRRRMCRAGFFLLCVVPTVLVAGWCVVRCRPGRVAAEATRLSRELGLEVSLEGFQYLRPGVMRYEGVELLDPETGRTVLQCHTLRAEWAEKVDRQGQSKSLLLLTASDTVLETAAFDRLGQWLHRMLGRRAGLAPIDVRLAADGVVLHPGDPSDVPAALTELGGGIQSFSNGSQAWADFRFSAEDDGKGGGKPIRVRIVRSRGEGRPRVGFEVDTGGASVPCRLLAWGLPALDALGPRSEFSGYVRASRPAIGSTESGWDGEIGGQLTDVDLGRLVREKFPHDLSGIAEIGIERARFRRGRLEEASGTLSIGPGEMGRSLWEAAMTSLQLQPYGQPVLSGDAIPFEQLAVSYVLDSHGLRLRGQCPSAPAGTILVDRYGRFLGEPAGPLPVAALVQALIPSGEVRVSATRQTDWLMRRLPLPEAAVAVRADAPLSGARLGLRGSGRR